MERTQNLELRSIELRMVDDPYADASWMTGTDEEMGAGFSAAMSERQRTLEQGLWGFVGIVAVATVSIRPATQSHDTEEIHSGGLWGIESDSDTSYFDEIGADELSELVGTLLAEGFTAAEIDAAEITTGEGTVWDRDTRRDWVAELRSALTERGELVT